MIYSIHPRGKTPWLSLIPYGKWDTIIPFEALWEQYKQITKKDADIVLFGTQPFTIRYERKPRGLAPW
jgi:hypothetical protein